MSAEMLLVWATIVLYALSTAGFVLGTWLAEERFLLVATALAAAGFATQAAMLVSRWIATGHPPLLGFFEVASLLALLSVGGFLLLVWRYRGLRAAGVAVMPVSLLILGATLLVDPAAEALSGSLASIWLGIHVLFANLAYGCYAAAFVLAAGYLMRSGGRSQRFHVLVDRLPPQEDLDSLQFRLVGAGFIFQGVMIASGAIWANEAWGRYWAWDPMETWSLVAWAIYALYLHLTLTLGWRGKRAATILIVALPLIVFSLLGVPVVYRSIHGAYLRI